MLELHPAQGCGNIECTIRHVSLSEKPNYDALSYCWGDPTRNVSITCNNHRLAITRNLLVALRQLRRNNGLTTLWVDGVCINQDDIEEKNEQVRLMRDIFHRSQRTLVWLGEESEDSKTAMQLMQALARTSQKPARKGKNCPAWYHGVDNIPPLYSPTWRAFSTLLRRPWFYRAWIVQEVAVCTVAYVMCGNDVISWSDLHKAVTYVVDVGVFFMFPEDTTYQLLMIAGTRQQFMRGIQPRLLNLLLRNRSFSATDPRDMIFTLWALADARDIRSLGLEPDYRLRAEQVYKEIAISFLKTRKDLTLFNAPRVLEDSKLNGLPSWVPDWSTSDSCVPFGFLGSFGLRDAEEPESLLPYKASGSTSSMPQFDNEENQLGLLGMKFDRIEAVGETFHAKYQEGASHMAELFEKSRDIIELLVSWQKIAAVRSKVRYINGEKRLDAYWQTLCAGYMPEGYEKMKKEFYRWNRFLRPFNHFLRLFGHLFPRHEKLNWHNFLFFLTFRLGEFLFGIPPSKIPQIGFPPQMVVCNHRRMIRTRMGYIGLAPRYAQVGDLIAVFKGGKLPLVIRQSDPHWELIGESYVHGIMKGEAYDEERCEIMWLR